MAAPKQENVKANVALDNDDVKLVIYDFDQTITCIHLYHELNSGDNDQESELEKMSNNRLIEIFGGKNRIQRLNEHFNLLKSHNIEIAIISFGYVDVIKNALKRMNLFDSYFKNSIIIGADSIELDDADGSKAQCIINIFKKNLKKNQIIFVDDDQYNIKEANHLKVCKTVVIEPRKGMNHKQMQFIENIASISNKQKHEKIKNNNNNNNNDNDQNQPINTDTNEQKAQ